MISANKEGFEWADGERLAIQLGADCVGSAKIDLADLQRRGRLAP